MFLQYLLTDSTKNVKPVPGPQGILRMYLMTECLCDRMVTGSEFSSLTFASSLVSDVNKCLDTRTCPSTSTCTNTVGGYYCTCKSGHTSSTGEKHFNSSGVTCLGECYLGKNILEKRKCMGFDPNFDNNWSNHGRSTCSAWPIFLFRSIKRSEIL